jgi:hypothetical protein
VVEMWRVQGGLAGHDKGCIGDAAHAQRFTPDGCGRSAGQTPAGSCHIVFLNIFCRD